MIKKLAIVFLLGGGGYLIWRALSSVDKGVTDASGEEMGYFGGLMDTAYGLGDSVVGSVMSGINDDLSTSLNGLAFIKGWEVKHLMPYYATDYERSKGILTIGYGHTYKDSDLIAAVQFGNGITDAQAEALFISDISKQEDPIRNGVKVRLTQNQFDALVAFRLNTGRVGPTMLEKLNNGDYTGAGNEFMRWVYQGGVVLNGLYKRRAAESQIWFNNYYNSAH